MKLSMDSNIILFTSFLLGGITPPFLGLNRGGTALAATTTSSPGFGSTHILGLPPTAVTASSGFSSTINPISQSHSFCLLKMGIWTSGSWFKFNIYIHVYKGKLERKASFEAPYEWHVAFSYWQPGIEHVSTQNMRKNGFTYMILSWMSTPTKSVSTGRCWTVSPLGTASPCLQLSLIWFLPSLLMMSKSFQ